MVIMTSCQNMMFNANTNLNADAVYGDDHGYNDKLRRVSRFHYMQILVSEYPSYNLALHHPVWLLRDYEGMNETTVALVDGDTHTCSTVYQPFWAVDLGPDSI